MENIKIQAGLFVAKFISLTIVVSLSTVFGLRYLSQVFGEQAVMYGVGLSLGLFALYYAVSLLYEVRLAQLKFEQYAKNK